MNQIKYKIKAGKFTEEGVVDTVQQLYNRLKFWDKYDEFEFLGKKVSEGNIGKIQGK